jgi:hypothetical protein
MLSLDQDPTALRPSSTSVWPESSPALAGEGAQRRARCRGSRAWQRGCRTAVAAWLLHLARTATPTAARNFPNAAARVCSTSDVSEREKKRERLGSVAVMVCCFWASTGGFYRHGEAAGARARAWAVAGKTSRERRLRFWRWSRGWLSGVAVPPHTLWHARWHQQRSAGVRDGRLTRRQWRNFSTVHRPGSGLTQWGVDSGERGGVVGYCWAG